MIEQWKTIDGFPGYEVSWLGRVKSLARIVRRNTSDMKIQERILKIRLTSNGYVRVSMRNENGHMKSVRVHRIVLAAFVGPCPDGHEARHHDGIRVNNRLDNLLWGTAKANQRDRINHKTDNGMRIRRSDGVVFRSQIEAARQTGCSNSGIWRVLQGETAHYAGFGWEEIINPYKERTRERTK